ncbi:TRAP transporter large permease [Halomonas sp. McH1-25]|uniref:TRAP transporter large permease n=1 Tax=unclassified Halomonas TaxID=2609666 RepID=UPI001EF4796F|nr:MULTISPECIES: TRAP transporter large permease [unclassified Halomonas]MCG7602205.1 TRAP transporter large permease [Halomonas sp. McH1-25]MCP1344466.1 TRAP transporter large permease [Halomonas sp. FL8]MCP1362787.1 TRAP transporter large permease [Halomonas sp. BBD45]MCP1363708.1 TRAP transporter large permease [Halomonas sp. BBD48]
MSAIFFISFIILAVLSLPIAFSMVLAGVIAIIGADTGMPLTSIPQRMYVAVDSFPFLAVAFFVLVGDLMSIGGLTRRLIDLAASFIGALHGGLAIVTQVAGSMMDAMSGSSAASTAAMGSVMLPEMIREKYDKGWSATVVAASGVTGVIIPPSITFVVYGSVANVSISQLFLGGVIPGFLIVLSLCLLFSIQAKRRGYPVREVTFTATHFFVAFRRAGLALFIPVIVLGGIYGGIFTPTEAGAVAALYAIILSVFVYRDLAIRDLAQIFIRSGVTTGTIMIVVAGANILGFVVTFEQVPQQVANYVLALSESPIIILLLLMGLFMVAGMFITASAAVVILVPLVTPMVAHIGIDPVMFGVLAVVNLGIGTVTPPLGINLFIVSGIGEIPMDRIFRELGPVLAVLLLDLMVLCFFPDIIMFLPEQVR